MASRATIPEYLWQGIGRLNTPVTLGQLFWYVALEGMYTVNSRWQCNAAFFKTIEPDMVSVSVMVFKYCMSMSNDYMNLYYRCILARIIYFLTTIIAV